ncbi:hypothetical protein KEM55_004723 [Ascosphaera atra]|nr:hypothetical protein KEM55_004723 [Ascosphaera atra]
MKTMIYTTQAESRDVASPLNQHETMLQPGYNGDQLVVDENLLSCASKTPETAEDLAPPNETLDVGALSFEMSLEILLHSTSTALSGTRLFKSRRLKATV